MKVLFLHAARDGLTPEYNVHLTLSMYARSIDFVPFYLWQSPIEDVWCGADRISAHDFGCRTHSGPSKLPLGRWGAMLRRLPHTMLVLASQIRQIRPDAIYTSQQKYDVLLGSLLSKRYQIPHIIHLHYNVGPWLGRYTMHAIRRSSRLIAVSEWVRQTALLQGIDPAAIHTVINPVPVSRALPEQAGAAIRAEFGIEAQAPLVLAVGRLDAGKGHLDLFEAFAQVVQEIPAARLLICGVNTSGDHFDAGLRKQVAERNLQSQVIFAGYRSDVRTIMRSADVFCLPTVMDPCPLAFLEAMYAGLPVVAYYSGGVPEIVQSDRTGLLSYPGDIRTLAANLQSVLRNPGYARQLGEAGVQRAMTDFAPAMVAEYWLKVLSEKFNRDGLPQPSSTLGTLDREPTL
jgi:glycosyltransferase involved in cell wall biosynthesis